MNIENHPKVFISYSWDNDDNEKHKNWVLKLATDLRHHGVDVVLDQWDARLGNDLAFFMEQGLTNSQLVICVCSAQYTTKANQKKGGVGYEKRIISSNLISDANRDYIIPIIRNNPEKVVPIFLEGLKYADFTNDLNYISEYGELVARIYDEDLKRKPPLGNNPFKSSEISKTINLITTLQEVEFCNPALEGTVEFDYKRNSGKFIIGEGNYTFNLSFSECGNQSIYCYRDNVLRVGYNPKYKEFPNDNDLLCFDYSSRCKSLKIGEILILENKANQFAAIKILDVKKNTFDIDHLVKFAYKIYTPKN